MVLSGLASRVEPLLPKPAFTPGHVHTEVVRQPPSSEVLLIHGPVGRRTPDASLAQFPHEVLLAFVVLDELQSKSHADVRFDLLQLVRVVGHLIVA